MTWTRAYYEPKHLWGWNMETDAEILDREIAVLEADLEVLKRAREILQKRGPGTSSNRPAIPSPKQESRPKARPQHGGTRVAAIRNIMLTAGGPVTVDKLVEALRKRGENLGVGKTAFKRVDTTLRYAPRHFKKVGTATWDLVDRAAEQKEREHK